MNEREITKETSNRYGIYKIRKKGRRRSSEYPTSGGEKVSTFKNMNLKLISKI